MRRPLVYGSACSVGDNNVCLGQLFIKLTASCFSSASKAGGWCLQNGSDCKQREGGGQVMRTLVTFEQIRESAPKADSLPCSLDPPFQCGPGKPDFLHPGVPVSAI